MTKVKGKSGQRTSRNMIIFIYFVFALILLVVYIQFWMNITDRTDDTPLAVVALATEGSLLLMMVMLMLFALSCPKALVISTPCALIFSYLVSTLAVAQALAITADRDFWMELTGGTVFLVIVYARLALVLGVALLRSDSNTYVLT